MNFSSLVKYSDYIYGVRKYKNWYSVFNCQWEYLLEYCILLKVQIHFKTSHVLEWNWSDQTHSLKEYIGFHNYYTRIFFTELQNIFISYTVSF